MYGAPSDPAGGLYGAPSQPTGGLYDQPSQMNHLSPTVSDPYGFPSIAPKISMQPSENPNGTSSLKSRQENWQAMHNIHRKVGTELSLKGFSPGYNTRGFIFSIKGASNIPFADVTAPLPV